MSTDPTMSTISDARRVRETSHAGASALRHPEWSSELPWLVQGTTTRGTPDGERDLGLFGRAAHEATARKNWDRLLTLTGMIGAAHARQVHGAEVRWHASVSTGLRIAGPCDGHVTDQEGLLLAVSVADCVPVFVVAPEARAVAAIHAGWRGTAAGVLESGLGLIAERAGADPSTLHVHLGPAICGQCYEVGPEVFAALGRPSPPRPRPIDLREILTRRAVAAGVAPSRLTVSAHCTRCTGSDLFSHRGGDPGRQVGYIGVRP